MGQASTSHAIDDFQQVCYFNQEKKKKNLQNSKESCNSQVSPPVPRHLYWV